ncbi:helix-turn-helix domain-containing protein [Sphaerisporangium perillae]|uniref:helix-turn-helix domain-containing protein n=1 Tax=Sphaerisporangium perillae TaxID=2935860 RepID=UPI00200EB8D9|nr:TetR/AcrR family transcriptional regulator [Sphaerisporangium perillae]
MLDVAERLVADGGPERLTVRGLAAASGVSNGAIYHAFGSLPALLGRVWLRAAGDFLDLQVELVDAVQAEPADAVRAEPLNAVQAKQVDAVQAEPADAVRAEPLNAVQAKQVDAVQAEPVVAVREDGREAAVAAVVAAAGAPAVFADRRPAAARMLMEIRRDRLLGPEVPQELAEAMFALDKRLVALLVRLARALWGRADGASVEVVTLCVVDLPTAVFRRALTAPSMDGGVVIGADSRERLEAAVRAVLSLPPPPPRVGRAAPPAATQQSEQPSPSAQGERPVPQGEPPLPSAPSAQGERPVPSGKD